MSDVIADAGLRIDRLEASKETLLAILREAYETGPKAAPFDDEKAWDGVFRTTARHQMYAVAADFPTPGKNDVRRYEQIAGALSKARDLLSEDAASENEGGVMMDIWHEDYVEQLPAGEIERDVGEVYLARMKERYSAAVETVGQLARAAEESAKHIRSKKKQGRPRGGAHLPDEIIIILAAIFKTITGVVPAVRYNWERTKQKHAVDQDETFFEKFIMAYAQAIGKKPADSTLIEAVKRVRTWSLKPENQEWAPSPFKA